MSVKLLTEHHLEFLSLQGVCTGTFESTLVKMPYYWKSHVVAHLSFASENKTERFFFLLIWKGSKCTILLLFLCYQSEWVMLSYFNGVLI